MPEDCEWCALREETDMPLLEIAFTVAMSAETALVYHQAGPGAALVWLGCVAIAFFGSWGLVRFFRG